MVCIFLLTRHILSIILILVVVLFFHRTLESVSVHAPKTQEQQKTEDAVHHLTAASFRKKVSPEAVPLHCRKSGVFQFTQSNRDTSEDMVPKQESESKETPRSRVRETETRLKTPVTGVRLSLPTGSARGFSRSVRSLKLFSAAFTARAGTFWRTRYLWDVLFVLNVFSVIYYKTAVFASHKRTSKMSSYEL